MDKSIVSPFLTHGVVPFNSLPTASC